MAKYEDLRGDEASLLAVTGGAWVFGDHISSQQILAEDYHNADVAVASRHVMTAIDPTFAARVVGGDLLVAGLGFGADATHRAVAAALKQLGLAAVIARSFGRFFEHHAIRLGLPALVVEETAAVKTGDRLRVDVEAHIVANLSSGDRYVIRNIDDEALAWLRASGT